ncbi:MAG: NAD(+)/NADH kinase [Holophagales bacterium]|nr:NAD(+)/NADH kinase [Holophagales bacterium]
MRRGLLVYNPAAGGHDRTAQMAALAERARGRGVVLSLLATERPGHATQLVAQGLADGPDLVAVAGGDGTIAEAASALVGSDVPLAVLPAGTTNVIARELGLGRSPEEAAEFLSSTATRTVTTWPAAGRTSLICTGVGFDARVMANVNPTLKRLFGRVGFSLTATYEWARYEFPPIEVTGLDADGAPFSRRATFVIAANTSKYAGDAILTPFADPGDDLLDLVLFTSGRRIDLLHFYRLLPGGRAAQLGVRGVERFPVRSFTARSLAGYELEVQVDGDGAGTTPVTVGPAGGHVRFLVPPASA